MNCQPPRDALAYPMFSDAAPFVRRPFVRALCLASTTAFLGATVARPIVDPGCLEHHSGADHSAGHPSGSTSGPVDHVQHAATRHGHLSTADRVPDADRRTDTELLQACLCWFAGMVPSAPAFAGADDVRPIHPPMHGPASVSLRPTPFALPFGNGPPVLI